MTLASIALFLLWVANLLSVGKQHVTGLHVACAAALLVSLPRTYLLLVCSQTSCMPLRVCGQVKVVEMGVQLGYDSRMDTVGTVVGSYRIASELKQQPTCAHFEECLTVSCDLAPQTR
jgi:hypothetical protein